MCGLETEYDLHRVLKLNNQAPIINDGLEKKKKPEIKYEEFYFS